MNQGVNQGVNQFKAGSPFVFCQELQKMKKMRNYNKKKKSAACGTKAEDSVRLGSEFSTSPIKYKVCGGAKFLLNYLRRDSRVPDEFIWDLKRQFTLESRSDQKKMAKCLLDVLIFSGDEDLDSIKLYARTGNDDIDHFLENSFRELYWYLHGMEYLLSLNYHLDKALQVYTDLKDLYIKKHLSFMDFLKHI